MKTWITSLLRASIVRTSSFPFCVWEIDPTFLETLIIIAEPEINVRFLHKNQLSFVTPGALREAESTANALPVHGLTLHIVCVHVSVLMYTNMYMKFHIYFNYTLTEIQDTCIAGKLEIHMKVDSKSIGVRNHEYVM